MPGTPFVSAKTGGATASYWLGAVSALMSSTRLAAPERVPLSVRSSGVRYEYPAQPIALLPDGLGASATRAWRALEAMSLMYRPAPITADRRNWLSLPKSLHSAYMRRWSFPPVVRVSRL